MALIAAIVAMGFTSFLLVAPIQPAHAESLGQWAAISHYAGPTLSASTCLTGDGYTYCIGGGETGIGTVPYVFYAPISSSTGAVGTWNATTGYPVPFGIYGESCVISEGYIYCVGGQTIHFQNNVTVSSVRNDTYYAQISPSTGGIGAWVATTSYPTPILSAQCVASGGYIYCMSGDTGSALDTNAVYYAPLTSSGIGAWTMTTPMPSSIRAESCAVGSGAYVYCVGGNTTAGTLTNNVNYALLSSLGVGAWTSTTNFPTDIASEGCTTSAGYLYCVGGVSDSAAPVATVYYALTSSSGGIGTWTGTTNYPAAVSVSCTTSGGYVYCQTGGFYNNYYTPITSLSQQTSQLTVTTQNTSGQTLTGYYTVLYQSGNVLGTGFSPAAFTLNNGQTYVVQVDDYGSCHFDHWADTGETTSWRYVSIGSDTTMTAVYACVGSVTVNSIDQNGHAIFGYYTAVWQDGNVIATGFTTKTFSTTSGQTYSVEADSYGSCTFAKWSDVVANDPRTFTATSGPLSFTAVYICGSSTINVSTVNSTGTPISGYYTTLWKNGVQLGSCFSACSFTVNNGQTYQVAVADYGSESFSHWSDGTTTRFHTVIVPSANSSSIPLTAIYNP